MSLSEPHRFGFDCTVDPRLSLGQRLALALLTFAIWVATHRYSGIWHDGVLYAGQALNRLYPERFVGDLFFAYGSQDSFSVFSPLYAGLISVVGINPASLILTVFAQCAWLVSAALLAKSVLQGVLPWVGLLAITALPRVYGADDVFAYAEVFATARVLSELLVLAGLACLYGGRRVAGNSLLLGAALFHPVIAFPGIAVAFAMQASWRIVLAASTCAFLAVPLLAFGVPDAREPLRVMDSLWYGISIERSPFVFLGQWELAELAQPVIWVAILSLASRMSLGFARRFWHSVIYAGTIGFALAAMADCWPIALLVQMQTWRSAWLLQVCGILAAVWLIQALWSQGRFGRLLLIAMATCLFAGGDWGFFAGAFLAMSYSALARWRPLVDLVEKHYPLFVAGFVFASLPEVLIVMRELVGAMRAVFIDAMLALPQVSSELVLEQPSVFWLALGTMALFMILSDWSKPVFRVLAGLAVLVTLLISGLSWVALLRPEYRPLVGSDEPPTLLREAIPPGSLTYMEGGHGYLWFVLGRPSYASHHQAAGVIFSRRTALEAQRRLNAIALLGTSDERLQWRIPESEAIMLAGKEKRKWIPTQALVSVCQDPILDFVVLRRPLRGEPAVNPFSVVPVALQKGQSPTMLYVFECRRLRN